MGNLFRRLRHLLNRPQHERELVREMREHRASMTAPLSYLTALVVLACAGGVAAIAPVLRALRTDPIRTLRHE